MKFLTSRPVAAPPGETGREDGIPTVAGVQVLRFTWDQLQNPERVLVRLAAAITLAQHRRRTPITT